MRIRTKVFLLLFGFTSVFLGYFHLFWLPQLNHEWVQLTEDEYRAHLRTASEGLVPLLLENRLANVYETLDALAEDNQVWQQIILETPKGQRLYPLAEVTMLQPSETLMVITEPVGFLKPPMAVLTVAIDLAPAIKVTDSLVHQLGIALSLLAIGFIVAVGGVMEFIVRRPLDSLVAASNQLAIGQYEVPLPQPRTDEIGALTRSFTEMRSALQRFHVDLAGEVDNHRRTADALKEAKDAADYQASHDSLTGLINRREFEKQVVAALHDANAYSVVHSLLYIDLDQFKVVNDTCGHAAGDELLRQVANLLSNLVRGQDTFARLGGDEFGLLLNCCEKEDAQLVGAKICDSLAEFRFGWEGKIFGIGASIGLTHIDSQSRGIEELLSQADSACYMAKEEGRNRVHVHSYTDQMLALRKSEMLWTSRLTQALEQDAFLLYAQPILPINPASTEAFSTYEILLRLPGNQGQLVLPGAFIPAAERYNLIGAIDHWVFDALIKCLSERAAWEGRVRFNLNLSGASLGNADLLRHIIGVLQIRPYLAPMLCFEITESEAVRNMTEALHFIEALRHFGCRFALDDFGSGMCSFSYLKHLPVDYLKIDGSFVLGVAEDRIDEATVRSINEIGHVMGMKTVAESVETKASYDALKKLEIDYGQGYYFGEPTPLEGLQLPTCKVAGSYDSEMP